MRRSKRDNLSKMTSAGDVRRKLRKYSNRNYRFTATVGTINANNMCLVNIYDKESNERISHHIWIGNGKKGGSKKISEKYNLIGGDKIEFSAKVQVYYKPNVIGEIDYGLKEINNIKVVEKYTPPVKDKRKGELKDEKN